MESFGKFRNSDFLKKINDFGNGRKSDFARYKNFWFEKALGKLLSHN